MSTQYLLTRSSLMLCAALLLSACAATRPPASLTHVEQQLGERYPNARLSTNSAADSIPAPDSIPVSEPLNLEAAIQTMLARSPQVQIELAQLGIADAQRLQAELISNPHLSIGALRPEGGGRWELDVGLSQPLLELFTRPLRRELADENILTVQLQLQAALQALIAQTGDAYYAAVAARQHLQVQQQMLEATLARQQLAGSLHRAGNISENNFLYYDKELRLVQQQVKKSARDAQEKYLALLNMIGLDSQQVISLPNKLPTLPADNLSRTALLTQAHKDRLDINIIQQQLIQLERRRDLIRTENGWRDMSVGINAEREFDGATNVGPEIEFALPIFNRNQGKLAATDAKTTKTQAQLAQAMLTADTEIAQALNQMQSAREQLDLLTASLQIAQKRVLLSNREVNFMLGSPFELLEIKREEIQLAHDYTNELANYWHARTRLELAIGRALPVQDKATNHNTNHTNHADMDHSKMDHRKMNHSDMDHSKMNHNEHKGHDHD